MKKPEKVTLQNGMNLLWFGDVALYWSKTGELSWRPYTCTAPYAIEFVWFKFAIGVAWSRWKFYSRIQQLSKNNEKYRIVGSD